MYTTENQGKPLLRAKLLLFSLFISCIAFSQSSPREIIDMSEIIPGLKTDIKYATSNNFVKQKLYTVGKAFGSLAMTQSLKAVSDSLSKIGIGIKIFDAYRPRIIQWLLWEIVPNPTFVADPKSGSRHNRGSAVDLTLYNLTTGKELAMPSPFDEFSERASHNFQNLPDSVKANRKLLKDIMINFGFDMYDAEWWHYNHTISKNYKLKDFQMR
jgi:D-alanyl-D-alanine dipeptidase